jgi:hypothetical protein
LRAGTISQIGFADMSISAERTFSTELISRVADGEDATQVPFENGSRFEKRLDPECSEFTADAGVLVSVERRLFIR